MMKFDFNDHSPEMFEGARPQHQQNPVDETPTLPPPVFLEQHEDKLDEGLKKRMVQEELNHQAEVVDPGIQSTTQDISNVKTRLKRKSDGPVSRAMKNGRPATANSVPELSADAAIKQVADLVKKLGTDKVRELCDLIDCVAK